MGGASTARPRGSRADDVNVAVGIHTDEDNDRRGNDGLCEHRIETCTRMKYSQKKTHENLDE